MSPRLTVKYSGYFCVCSHSASNLAFICWLGSWLLPLKSCLAARLGACLTDRTGFLAPLLLNITQKKEDGWVRNRLGYVTFIWGASNFFWMLREADRHLSCQRHMREQLLAVLQAGLGWLGSGSYSPPFFLWLCLTDRKFRFTRPRDAQRSKILYPHITHSHWEREARHYGPYSHLAITEWNT